MVEISFFNQISRAEASPFLQKADGPLDQEPGGSLVKALWGPRLALVVGFFVSALFAPTALAQLNPGSALLLKSNPKPPTPEDLNPERYSIKPNLRPQRPLNAIQETPRRSGDGEPEPLKTDKREDHAERSVEPQDSMNAAAQEVSIGREEGKTQESGAVGPVDESSLHAEDRRLNQLEVSVAAGILNNQSRSNFSPRRYQTSSPAFAIGADIHLNSMMSLHTELMSSMRSDIEAVASGVDRISVEHQRFEAGVRWRRHFGLSRAAPSVTWGLQYFEYQLKVPGSATNRVRIKSTGVEWALAAALPQSPRLTVNFGLQVSPSLQHQEATAGAFLRSGDSNQSSSLRLWLMGEHIFDRRNIVFWRLSYAHERNLFVGNASAVDPISSVVPNGVFVQNEFWLLTLGWRWAN